MILADPLLLVLILSGMIVACVAQFRADGRWLLLAVAFEATNSVAVILPFLFPDLRLGHWNWTGKIIAVATSLCWLRATGLSRREIGLCLPSDVRGWIAAALGVLLLGALSTGERLLVGIRSLDTETIVFQATMPGLDEELAFRGLLFALLSRGLPTRHGRAAAAVIVLVLFWLVHVIAVRHGAVHLTGPHFDALLASFGFMALRLLTGSILVTMLAHDIDNVANVLA